MYFFITCFIYVMIIILFSINAYTSLKLYSL